MKPAHDTLFEQLHAAFPSKPINSYGMFDQWGSTYPDAVPYMDHVDRKSWDQLDSEYIGRRSDALGFLGTHHLVAVLPVYLYSMVEDGVWSTASGMLTLILARPHSGEDTGLGRARFDALVDALTEAQRTAVARALRAFADQDPDGSLGQAALTALEVYWQAYLPIGV